MIKNLWIKLFSIVLLIVVPLITIQYFMQKESIELAFHIAEKNNSVELLDSHMALLKKLSRFEPESADLYKKEFEATIESRNVVRDLKIIRANLIDDILFQTLRNMLFVLIISLLATYWIARSIASLLKRLVADNQTQALRLERLQALESWQKVARMMVHELRTPITPIKLVATDIEKKYQTLESSSTRGGFREYLKSAADLISSQVHVIERLIEGLTKFAKLPEAQKRHASISEFFNKFIEQHRDYGEGRIRIISSCQVVQDRLSFDPELFNLLFFNLLKNAFEANPDQRILIQIEVRQVEQSTQIRFANSGRSISSEIADEIFKPHVSTRAGNSGTNFGVGLTIAKKIAFDHNGDLYLAKSERPDEAVVFKLEIPNL